MGTLYMTLTDSPRGVGVPEFPTTPVYPVLVHQALFVPCQLQPTSGEFLGSIVQARGMATAAAVFRPALSSIFKCKCLPPVG